MSKIPEKTLLYGSYLIALCIPWITFSRWVFTHATSKAYVFYGLMSILGMIWVYFISTDSRYRLPKKVWYMIIPLVLYVFWLTVTTITARNTGLAFWGVMMRGSGLLSLCSVGLYSVITASLARRYPEYLTKQLKWVLIGGAVLIASVWFGDEGFDIGLNILRKGSGGGVTGNSSLAGAYGIFLLGYIAFAIAGKYFKKSWLWILAVLVIFSPLFINIYSAVSGGNIIGSARGALGGIGIGIVTAFLVYGTLSKQKLIRRISLGSIVIGIMGFIAIWIKLITPGTVIHQKFIDLASGTRFAFWEIAQKVMEERPVLGYGPANYPIAQSQYFDPQFLSKSLAFEAWTDQPHNVYYDIGVSGGYPAIVLYVLFISSLVYAIYRSDRFTNTQKAALVGTLIGYLAQDLVAFDGFITLFAFGTFCGIAYMGLVSPSTDLEPKSLSWQPYLLGVTAIVGIVGCYTFSYRPAHKARLFAEVLGSKLNERYPRYQEFLNGSTVGNYWDVGGFGYDEYKLYAANPASIKSDQKILPHAIRDVNAYITYLEEVTKTNKTDYRLYFTIINLYNTKIYFTDMPYDPSVAAHMTELIEYAQRLAPTDPRIYWLYAQLAAWKGDMDSVIKAYKNGIAIDPTLPVSHKLLLQFLSGTKNEKLYKEALSNAQQRIPGFTI